MRKILLIKMGDTFPGLKATHGDFEDMISNCLSDINVQISVYDARTTNPQPQLCEYHGVIVTGSHSMVTACELWSEALLPYIREMQQQQIPVFGICYGHQLIAKALGGEVGFHPLGPEPGTVEVSLTTAGKQDSLLGSAPAVFTVNVAHSQTVTKLPKGATLLAANSFEPHQAFRLGNIWAVQFHPEFTREITQYYIDEIADEIRKFSGDPQKISSACTDTIDSRELLIAFVEQACAAEAA
ncbi:MAG: glutamine amidotransferase [Pseudomonadales bacterium]|nr:glutamine amidotransferase [Pseudomonadales bacterium]